MEPAARRFRQPIAVLIPAYNLAAYLGDAVHSVQCQTYLGPLSIIILDDGSTDDTLVVARSLAAEDDAIRVYTQSNQGRARTRNRLLGLAEVDWLAWIDGDDIASPLWIEEQVGYLTDHPACVAVGGQGYAMTASRHAIGPIEHPLGGEQIDQRHLTGEANAFFQSCVMVRKSAVIQAGGYNEAFPAAEDFDLWLRLAEVGNLANVPSTHLYYRVHAGSANWTISVDQREQGLRIMKEARVRRGFEPLDQPTMEIPPARADDWNRRIYWTNIALRSGNPFSALLLLRVALRKHPWSLLLWFAAGVAAVDSALCGGNRTARFQPGKLAKLRTLPAVSCYRLARAVVRFRRRCKSAAITFFRRAEA